MKAKREIRDYLYFGTEDHPNIKANIVDGKLIKFEAYPFNTDNLPYLKVIAKAINELDEFMEKENGSVLTADCGSYTYQAPMPCNENTNEDSKIQAILKKLDEWTNKAVQIKESSIKKNLHTSSVLNQVKETAYRNVRNLIESLSKEETTK